MSLLLTRKFRTFYIPAFLLCAGLIYLVTLNHYQLRNALSYATRPLWDKADGPKQIIPHYYSEGMEMNEQICKLHGWTKRAEGRDVKVLDAVLMSSELDLLEIRMNELDSVVDRFFIIESNTTFTGLPKETYFANNKERFSKFSKKISYRFLAGHSLQDGQDAWDIENQTRGSMTNFLKSHIAEYRPDTDALLIMSDIDEIPSAHSIRLLKACDFGSSLHLQLRNYLYSFEWFLGVDSWRASIHKWNLRRTQYRHSKQTDVMLADAGWHCSYCFRTIPEYIMKMKGFSHSDRIGGNMALLEPERIQDTICKGKDIFGMLPEAYSYADLLSQMSLVPFSQKSAVGLPRHLLENSDKFKFLLPEGCMRETPGAAQELEALKADV